jgi:hypothetical protein
MPSSGGSGSGKKGKSTARIAGAACAGALELIIFHPVDTIAKRLMSTKDKYIVPGETRQRLSKIIFKDKINAPILQKYSSLFPGLGFAAGYKILQRVYKFGGQPFVVDLLEHDIGGPMRRWFGDRQGRSLLHAFAGSLVGIGEVVLLPLDVLKIKAQTNPEAFKNLGRVPVKEAAAHAGLPSQSVNVSTGTATLKTAASALQEAPKPSMLAMARSIPLSDLYRGAAFTAARNAPGSFALFGASQAIHQNLFHLEDSKKATFWQNFVASIGGATASITVAQPFDIVKTRLQNRNFGEKSQGGMKVFASIIANEGPTALFKGITPKLLVVGPKLIFSFTVAQTLIAKFQQMADNK